MESKIIRKLSNWGYKKSDGKVVLISFGLFILFAIFVLPEAAIAANEYSQGIGSIDLGFGNSGKEIVSFLQQYGEEGRAAYLKQRWTVDLAFPLIFALFGFTANSYLFKSNNWDKSKFYWGNTIIVFGMIFDYLENSFASILIMTIDTPNLIIANILSAFSAIKWLLVIVGFATVFLAGIANLIYRYKN